MDCLNDVGGIDHPTYLLRVAKIDREVFPFLCHELIRENDPIVLHSFELHRKKRDVVGTFQCHNACSEEWFKVESLSR